MPRLINSLHFDCHDFMIDSSELTPELLSDLSDCGASGGASEAVAYVRSHYSITGDTEVCAELLRPYGAWEDDELTDHNNNLDRLVWLAGCDLCESDEIYFAGY